MNAIAPKAALSEKEIITGLQSTVSASRLGLFLQCRLKFYFRYVAQIQKPKTPSLHVGNAVHSALKAWNKARWLNKPLSLKALHDEFSKAWAAEPVQWEPGEEEDEKTGPEAPAGKLAEAIGAKFGGLAEFKKAFASAALSRFGSGWAWLSYDSKRGLFISTTPNEDNPLMKGLVPESEHGRPVLCLDVWEHAYYLKYQNRRADYIAAWWNVVNWPRIEQRYTVVTTTAV
jgi:superoxide dismutase